MKKILVMAFICLSTLGHSQLTSKEEVTPDQVEKREAQKKEITKNYLALKNSLIISDSLAVVKNADALKASLKNFKFKKLTLEKMNEATTKRRDIIDLVTQVAAVSYTHLTLPTILLV